MKWLKFRETWAWGCSEWKYRPLYLSRIPKEDRVEIKEEMNDLADEYNYSDKFRGIEWKIINTKQVPNKHIAATYEGIKRRIHHYKEAIKDMKKSLPLIDALKDKGRKTCPDELYRAKIERLRKKSMAKRKQK
jgi:hypothetical protein